jgi:hypothetical protein
MVVNFSERKNQIKEEFMEPLALPVQGNMPGDSGQGARCLLPRLSVLIPAKEIRDLSSNPYPKSPVCR